MSPPLERRHDLRPSELHGRHPHLLQHPCTNTGDSHPETLELIQGDDFGLEPSGALRADAEAVDCGDPVCVVELLTQLLTATMPLPGTKFADLRAERGTAEEVDSPAQPLLMVDGNGPDCVNLTRGHGVEVGERAGFLEADDEPSAGHLLHPLRESDRGLSVWSEGGGERTLHVPADVLCVRLRSACGQAHGECHRRRESNVSSKHVDSSAEIPDLRVIEHEAL